MITGCTPLQDLLEFKCSKSITSFHYTFGVPLEESSIIFQDMLRFLWMAQNQERLDLDKSVFSIDPAIVVIDEMWHTFILHTRVYMNFCMANFGTFLHHDPHPKGDSPRRIYDLNETELNDLKESRRKKYACVYDLFGEETFKRWYLHYPTTYSLSRLQKNRK